MGLKKLLALFLTFVILSPMVFAQNGNIENDFQYSDYEDEINTLANLGIIQLFEDNTFRPEQKFTRAEAAAYMVRLNAASSMAVDAYTFFPWNDVNENTEYAGEILQAYSLGIMVGESEKTFNPEGAVTGLQLGIMISRILKYDFVGISFGGYPQGYERLIRDLNLLDGITINLYEPLKRKDATAMIYNALEINLMELSGDGSKFEVSEDENILTKYLGLIKGEAIVKGNSCTNLNRNGDMSDGKIILGDITVDEGEIDASEYLGYYVTYYIDEETNILKHIVPKDNKNVAVEIKAEDLPREVVDESIRSFYYYENNKIKRLSLDESVDIVYNGCVWDNFKASDFEIKKGQIKLLDNNSDGKFDLVFIEEYEDYIITNVDDDSKVIYTEDNKMIKYQDADEIEIYDKSGTKVNVTALSNGSVLSAYISKEGNYVKAYTASEFKQAVILGISTDEDGKQIIKTDNEIFIAILSDELYNMLRVGNEVKLSLNAYGYVVKVETVSTGEFHYGYIFKAYKDEIDETQGQIKLMDATTQKYEVLQCAEEVRVNGKKRNEFNQKYNFDLLYDEVLSKNGKVEPQVIKFALDADGKINKLYTVLGVDKLFDKESLVKVASGNIHYWQSGSTWRLGSSYRLGGDTIRMYLPPADEDGKYNPELVRFSNIVYHNHFYNMEIYDVDEDYIPKLVVFKNFTTSLDNTRFNVLVDKIITALNKDEEPCEAIVGWQNGKQIQLIVSDSVSLSDIKQGMVIEVNKDGNGVVTGITKAFDLEKGTALSRTVNSGNMMDFYLYFYGTVWNKGTDSMQVNYKDEDLTSMVTVQYGQGNVYLYDKSVAKNKISVVSEKNAIEGVSKVLVRFSDGVTRDVFIVKE